MPLLIPMLEVSFRMSKYILNVGLIGNSKILNQRVLPDALTLMSDIKIFNVASKSQKPFPSWIERNSIITDSYDDVCRDENIELVYVSTTNDTHYAICKSALENKKHVICEKPITLTQKQAETLVHLARSNKCMLIETFQYRFHSRTIYLKELLSSGAFGVIQRVNIDFGFPSSLPLDDFRYNPNLGGGAINDVAVYGASILNFLFKDTLDVRSHHVSEIRNGVPVSGAYHLLLEENNVVANVCYGFNHTYRNCVEIWGSKNTVTAERFFTAPKDVVVSVTSQTNGQQETVEFIDNQYKNLFEITHKAIQSDDDEFRECNYDMILRTSQLMEKLRNTV